MNQADHVQVDLSSLTTYRESCLQLAARQLSSFRSLEEISAAIDDINVYPRLDQLSSPQGMACLDTRHMSKEDLDPAKQAILNGRVLFEHAAAGEATRLKLGIKFLIDVADSMTLDKLVEFMACGTTVQEVEKDIKIAPSGLLHLSLGARHMLQISFEIFKLAREAGLDPAEVLANQVMLVIVNQTSAEKIVNEFIAADFFGFRPQNTLFMVQESFNGLTYDGRQFAFSPDSPALLHNHGQMVMQETIDDQVFYLDPRQDWRPVLLKADQFFDILDRMDDKISFNIEDLSYLTGALDLPALALALKAREDGYRMVMEVTANSPEKPQKGGMAAYDRSLQRNVMIESFQLKGVSNSDIKYLNRNINHYPNPGEVFRKVRSQGLNMPFVVKHGFLYFQPVQGDINFLVNTLLITRKEVTPISAWKTPQDTVKAINAMFTQDRQIGFRAYARSTLPVWRD
ncbi:MAG: hypothetical protein HQK59_10675 [Deltaproteobacteria bacterium]|nr:hypothetical protein [Deltaproteobacteria bacterium]